LSRGVLFLSGSAVAAVLAVALAIGWNAPGRPTPPLSVTRYPRIAEASSLSRPNEDMDVAVAALRDDLGPDAAAASARAPSRPRYIRVQRPPAPPPMDEALVFRRQVAAVVNLDGSGLAVLLANRPGDEQGPRLLKLGDLFDGRWRIVALSMDEVVLQDGTTEKRAPLFGGLGGVGAMAQ
jgi:hypothetical protein